MRSAFYQPSISFCQLAQRSYSVLPLTHPWAHAGGSAVPDDRFFGEPRQPISKHRSHKFEPSLCSPYALQCGSASNLSAPSKKASLANKILRTVRIQKFSSPGIRDSSFSSSSSSLPYRNLPPLPPLPPPPPTPFLSPSDSAASLWNL